MYKTDLHCHTSELSLCSSESAADTVKRYVDLGYTSVVITNHFTHGDLKHSDLSYEEYVDRHFEVAENVAKLVEGRINVIPGIELNVKHTGNDYLVFGATREVLYAIPNIFDMPIYEIHDHLSANGCLLIQAHPMRFEVTLVRPHWVDGYEVLNTHVNHPNHNDIAMLVAKSIGGEGKILTAGSDHHDAEQTPSSGIMTDVPITDAAQLVSILKSGKYHIFGPEAH
ncbi:MAG: hypothetical protein IJ457_10025 [Clostridia bacterium]|nr:hypothetical protein [Clostridia bacterium]